MTFTEYDVGRELDDGLLVVSCQYGFFLFKTPSPLASVKWTLIGHTSAISTPHIDPSGFCTYLQIISGSKLWCLGIPNGRPLLTNDGVFDPDAFVWQAVLLKAGDQL